MLRGGTLLMQWVQKLDAHMREQMEDRVPQARIYRVYHAPAWQDADTQALEAFASVLSGSRSARLDRRLVYEQELATSVKAAMDPSEIACDRDGGPRRRQALARCAALHAGRQAFSLVPVNAVDPGSVHHPASRGAAGRVVP